ncbi:hypothetical protein MRABP9_gp02 [Acinetobacter phage MRABP9]|uniref:Uncharacterized protein n=1 Tax=Acinetobacter phage MRABP9 TaxID=2996150 RepID=A0A9E9BZ30_9CAUD|nr:hypothetical protein MRABP9_gp02 [Acinetobacter phage MRABP9]
MSNLNMPLAVLRPELTAEHKAKFKQLGFNEIDMSMEGEVSLILTDDGAGKCERAWTIGAPAFLIKMQVAMGNGTIFDTVDDLIAALDADTPKA